MKRLSLLFLLGAASLGAAGTVFQSFKPLGQGNVELVFQWTGDATTGTVPVTAAQLSGLPPGGVQGMRLLQVEVVPGTPAPTSGYNIALVDTFGADLMAGAMTGLSPTQPQIFSASSVTPPISGTFSLSITGQSVASAAGRVIVYFGPLQFVTSTAGTPGPIGATGNTGPQGPAGPPGTTQATATYTNDGTTGTTTNLLVKISANTTAVRVGTTDRDGAVGICTSGCGTTGSATITWGGVTSCLFDNTSTAGNYVQISSVTAGYCRDAGSAPPSSGQIIGKVVDGGTIGAHNVHLQIRDRSTFVAVTDFGALCDGTTNDTTAFQNALAALPNTGGTLTIPRATCVLSTGQWSLNTVTKKNIVIRGAAGGQTGSAGTLLSFTGTDYGFRITGTLNGNVAGNVTIEDITFYNTNPSSVEAGIDVHGQTTYIYLNRVTVDGFKYGVIFDQVQLGYIRDSNLLGSISAGAGLWIPNGAEHQTGGGANFGNVIGVYNTQFNRAAGLNLQDDGGLTHFYIGNNFNAGTKSVWLTAVFNGILEANHFEGMTDDTITISNVTPGLVTKNGCRSITLLNNFIDHATLKYSVNFVSVTNALVQGNYFRSANPQLFLDGGSTGILLENTQETVGAIATGATGQWLNIGREAGASTNRYLIGTTLTLNNTLTLGSFTFATLPTSSNGTLLYCSDCTVAATCAGAGSGALAKRINGSWVCN